MFSRNLLIEPSLKAWVYKVSGFGKYGLMRDDAVDETPDVTEALRRLPRPIYNERCYRIMRAVLLSANHKILPEKEWRKFEDDIPYLQPYLKEVIKEREEKEAWDNE